MKHLIAPLLLTTLLTACADKDNPTPTLQQAAEQSQKEVDAIQAPVNYIRETPVPGGLSPERINSAPALGGTTLSGVQIAPSGEFVTVLQGRKDNARQNDLWAYDLETGEGRLLVSSTDILQGPEILSEEEKNRRERAREYGSGIISYSWVGDSLLLFPLGGDIYLYDLETQESRQVTATKGFETDPKVSANGSTVAYVRDNELYIKDLKTGLERQLSDGSTDTIRNATASFVVQEELARNTGYWVSGDAKTVAYTLIDESAIAIENRIDFGADGVKNIAQRYPFAGTANATVKLGFVSATGGETRWVALDDDPVLGDDIYLTRVAWAPDNRTAFVGVLARNNKTHRIYKIDSKTGEKTEFYEETSPTWLNIRSRLSPTEDGGLIWSSERNDKRQLFKIDPDGLIAALTPENMNARTIACRTNDTLFVSGWVDSPLSNHIFKITQSDDVEAPHIVTQITSGPGIHSARFNGDCSRYLGTYSDDETPTNLRAYEADGTPLAWLNENKLDETHPYAPFLKTHISPEYGQLDADDGTKLDYMLFKPTDLKPGEKRPAITIVYNGPGVQRVQNRFWRKDLSKMLAHHGFVVFTLDGRGASNRGKAFEDHLHRSMGQIETADQSVGARWLAKQDFVDGDNMGIYGWSYGGYMTLHMLAQTDLYKSGVSGAPVTDWSLYDTAYTERYLGDPNPGTANYTEGAYEDGSVFKYLDGLTEPVLLIHGMADDNVVFRHSIKLMAAMQEKNMHNLRIQTYPGEKHGFRKTENRIHRDRQILEFFSETLAPEPR
ncbi:MAG: DPP IV N-terminal domain-containing protein [Litorimonas sp.]